MTALQQRLYSHLSLIAGGLAMTLLGPQRGARPAGSHNFGCVGSSVQAALAPPGLALRTWMIGRVKGTVLGNQRVNRETAQLAPTVSTHGAYHTISACLK